MPTGYTAAVQAGCSFEEFVWRAARGMVANWRLRDDSMDTPIPRYEPFSYYAKKLEEAKEKLVWIMNLSPEEIAAACAKEKEKIISNYSEMNKSKDEDRKKYQAMLDKVEAWVPPTPDHVRFKEFMREQLVSTIGADCSPCKLIMTDFLEYDDPMKWWKRAVERAEKDVAYHQKEYENDVRSAEESNRWNDALRKSVPQPAGTKEG
jgi:hypothetical protein